MTHSLQQIGREKTNLHLFFFKTFLKLSVKSRSNKQIEKTNICSFIKSMKSNLDVIYVSKRRVLTSPSWARRLRSRKVYSFSSKLLMTANQMSEASSWAFSWGFPQAINWSAWRKQWSVIRRENYVVYM